MKLTLRRIALEPSYTIGRLYIDGIYFCDTLEDTIRQEKIYGETAIPFGTYKIIINYSPKFNRNLPRLLNVVNFDGILIHPGNTAKDTHGCILVGMNTIKGRVANSKATFDKLYEMIRYEKDLTIDIV